MKGDAARAAGESSAGRGPPRPRPYFIVTGGLFALIALAHLARTIDEWRRFATDPWFVLEGPALGVVSGALAFWAWRLLRASRLGS